MSLRQRLVAILFVQSTSKQLIETAITFIIFCAPYGNENIILVLSSYLVYRQVYVSNGIWYVLKIYQICFDDDKNNRYVI